MADMDLHKLVLHHDGQLEGLNSRMGQVEKTLDGHGAVLNIIRDAVTKQDAKPQFDLRYSMDIAKNLGVVFAMICGGILYLAARNSEVDLATLKKDQATNETRLERMEGLILPERWATKETRK